MRKTLNINLGGLAFVIDENAFELLHTYLESLKRKFNNAAEREEILGDIEARIAEMLNQKLASRKEVVSLEDVQFVTEAMGKPEDIAGEEVASESTSTTSSTAAAAANQSATQPVNRKLFRDPDDAKIGGVISGLCHYFGINDPVWIRIAAIILIFLTSGTIILLYLLLLIVVPKANTAAEKLQMKGEPININTIEKEIRDAAAKATESVHKLVHDQNFFEKVWEIFVAIFKVFGKMFGAFLIVISMICLFSVSLCFFVLYAFNASDFSEASRMLVDSHATLVMFSFGFLLFFGAPLIGFIYLGLKLIIGERSRVKWLKAALLGLWIIGLMLLGITVYKTGINFKADGSTTQTMALMQPAKGSLYVQIADTAGKKASANDDDEDDYHSFNIDVDGIFVNGLNLKDLQHIPVNTPELQLVPSENDSFYVQEIISSQGRTKIDAEKNTETVSYNFSQTDTILNLSPNLFLEKGNKWRAQRIKIKLAIPEGKTLRFANNIDNWNVYTKGNNDDKHFKNTVWTVEKGQLKCIGGRSNRESEEVETHEDHDKPVGKDDKDDKDDDKGDY